MTVSFKNSFVYIVLSALLFVLGGCDKGYIDEIPLRNDGAGDWTSTTFLNVQGKKDSSTFITLNNLLDGSKSWKKDSVVLTAQLQSEIALSQISDIDFYIVAYEAKGDSVFPSQRTDWKLLKTLSSPASRTFSFTLKASDLYELVKTQFNPARTADQPRDGDNFMLSWVIKLKDGSSKDFRSSVIKGDNISLAVKIEDYTPPVWAGKFDVEWIALSPDAIYYGEGLQVGSKSTITITQISAIRYQTNSIVFDYPDGYGGTYKGFINYDFFSGKVSVSGSYNERWTISNVNGKSLDIAWKNIDTDNYGIEGTVRLTRTDGQDWPANIHTEK